MLVELIADLILCKLRFTCKIGYVRFEIGWYKLASEYTKAFSRLEGINTPLIADKNKSAWAQYTLSCENREKLQVELNLLGIPTAVYYPKPLPQQPALVSSQFGFGTSEKLSQTVLSLPFHAYMKEADFELITCSIIQNHKFK